MQDTDLAGGIVRRITTPARVEGDAPAADLDSLLAVSERRELAVPPLDDSPGVPYVLVLPFRDTSDESNAAYLADGLTESIIRLLGELGSTDVIGSQTSFALRERKFDVKEAREALGVDFVVDGTVEKTSDKVRIAVSLIDANTRRQLKGQTFEGPTNDVPTIEGEVATSIVSSLGIQLESSMLRKALRKRPENLSAYDCLLHAYQYQIKPSEAQHSKARDYLEEAVAIDPGYARAHAELARAYLGEELLGWNALPDPLGRAKRSAETAVRLDPGDPFGHHVLAMVHHQLKEFGKFEAEAKLCLDDDPNDSRLLADLGIPLHLRRSVPARREAAPQSAATQSVPPRLVLPRLRFRQLRSPQVPLGGERARADGHAGTLLEVRLPRRLAGAVGAGRRGRGGSEKPGRALSRLRGAR